MDREKLELLKKASIFSSLADDSLLKLAEMFREEEYPAGSFIFKEGQPGDSFMLIKSGEVEIIKRGSSLSAGVRLADRGPGEIFGEMALIEDSPRFADARARKDVSVLTLSKNQFKQLIAEKPSVAFEMMGSLSSKIRQSDLQMISDLEVKNAELEAANKTLKNLTLELKRSNNDLVRAKNFRDTIIANAPFFMIIADFSGSVVILNDSAEKTFGYPYDEIKGHPITDMIKAVNGQDVFDEVFESLESQGVWNGEMMARRSDGSLIIVDLIAVNVGEAKEDSENTPVLYMGQDITEEKNMQRQAFQLERMATRGELAAEIAHELNNYLSIVSGNLELLSMDIERGSYNRIAKKADSMKGGLARITKFVEGLMSISRPGAKMEIFDIHQFLDSELFFLKPQPKFKGIEIICRWGSDIPTIQADRSQLQQVLFNLLNNAADALAEIPPGRRRITISTAYSSPDDRIVLTINDNGCGMSGEDYNRAFRQHFSTKQSGHGFGLLAVKRVIKTHGGKISVAPGPEGGAGFKIELPRRIPTYTGKRAKALP